MTAANIGMRIVLVLAVSLISSGSMTQTHPPKVIAEFEGNALKWIHIAEPEFVRKNLDVNKYFVSVVEQGDSVLVILKSERAPEGTRGSTGQHPGYEVEIRKKDLKVVRSNYVR